jgi:hypothetical protein
MKKIAFTLFIVSLLMFGCKQEPKSFSTHNVSGNKYWITTYANEGEKIGAEVSYDIVWPDQGVISAAAERELITICFGDSSSKSFDEALRKWVGNAHIVEDGYGEYTPVDKLDTIEVGESHTLESSCRVDSTLALFIIKRYDYAFHAAHGLYSVDYLTVDLNSGETAHITDLVTDTALLCEAIARAIQDLDVNKDIRECLYEEFGDAERMPNNFNFLIDSVRNGIIVEYGLYEIAPYACGIQSVYLPIFWLSKHVPLTAYAKKLFGPDSYIE